MKNKIIIMLSVLSCSLFQASDIFKAIELNDKKVIQKWLKNNPDVDLINDQGQTVLIKAVQAGNKDLVKKLLKQRVAVNAIDQSGKMALDYAAELNKHKIVVMLAKKNATVGHQDNLQKVAQIKKHHRNMAIVKGVLISAGVYVGLGFGVIALVKFGCIGLM